MIFGPVKTAQSERTVALPKFLRELLAEHLAACTSGGTGPDALIFPGPQGGPMRHKLFYRRHFQPAVRAALPAEKHGLRFHDLRHTCASLLIAAGAHPKAIQVRLGHSDIRITMNRYGHLFPTEDIALADALDAVYTARPEPGNVAELRRAEES